MDNCKNTTKQLLKLLKVKHTNTYLKDIIFTHPDHPSLLSISDTLSKYQIENTAVRIDKDKFNKLPTPCIVQVSKQNGSLFYTVKKILTDKVIYYDHNNKLREMAMHDFLELWTGICLLAETTPKSKEKNIEKKLANKRFLNITIGITALMLIGWIIISFYKSDILENTTLTIYTILYSILKIIGLTTGVTLLWYDVDQYNPTLQNFCISGSKKINCNAVLQSKYASLFKGNLSLGLLGFSYFFATFLYMVLYNFSGTAMALLAFMSTATIPVVAISLYYQAAVIKQWCKFCMIIQGVLLTEIGIAFLSGFYNTIIDIKSLPLFFALLLIPISIWKLIKPLIEQQKETNIYKRGLKKIKANPFVLESLLSKSKKITHNPKGLGISINNENAKYHIIKVCNPYCGPCAKAHPILEELVDNGIINLQILFSVTNNEKDYRAKPVRHFLALDNKNNKEKTQMALDKWYRAENKDYKAFAKQFPLNGEMDKQNTKIEAMNKWCKAEKITHTPTIFINGYELPKEYSIEDLKEVTTVR